MMGVVLILSAAAEECADPHRDYCCMDFTAELTRSEAKLHDDLFAGTYHDTIISYCYIDSYDVSIRILKACVFTIDVILHTEML